MYQLISSELQFSGRRRTLLLHIMALNLGNLKFARVNLVSVQQLTGAGSSLGMTWVLMLAISVGLSGLMNPIIVFELKWSGLFL